VSRTSRPYGTDLLLIRFPSAEALGCFRLPLRGTVGVPWIDVAVSLDEGVAG